VAPLKIFGPQRAPGSLPGIELRLEVNSVPSAFTVSSTWSWRVTTPVVPKKTSYGDLQRKLGRQILKQVRSEKKPIPQFSSIPTMVIKCSGMFWRTKPLFGI